VSKRKVKTRGLPGKPPENQIEPKTEMDMKFCERWLVHRSHVQAYREAGFSDSANHTRSARKLLRFRRYLESRIPKIEQQVSQKIAYERTDILEGIARIAHANALDYIVPCTDICDGVAVQSARIKTIFELTRAEAAAIDTVTCDAVSGKISYTLPSAKTRLAAFTTLGEQAAGFSKKESATHNHLHLDVAPEKMERIKAMLLEAAGVDGPRVARQIFGMEPIETPEPAPGTDN
jgi:hypothetical protein